MRYTQKRGLSNKKI